MRGHGHYIKDRRLVCRLGYQRELIESIKRELKMSWADLAERMGVSEHTLRVDWRRERSTLPLGYAKKIAKILSLNLDDVMSNVVKILPSNWGQKLHHNGKKIRAPSLDDPEIAEFIGALLGDGHLTKYTVELCGDSRLDKHYLVNYIPKLVSNLFLLDGAIRVQQNTLRVKFQSREMSKWIVENFNFSYGKKVDLLNRIPKIFFKNVFQLAACIRGCVDTDGGIYRFYDRLAVAFFNKNKMLLKDVADGFKQLGFHPSFTKGEEVWILRRNDVLSYLSLVGTSNMKNAIRVNEWRNKGRFPSFSEVFELINKGINVELPYILDGPVV